MKKLILYIIGALLFVSCYDDKGNYDYDEVNKVKIGLDPAFSFRISDTTFRVDPKLSQSLAENKKNLKFVWLHNTKNPNFYYLNEFDTICETDTLYFPITRNIREYTHYFRLNVIDTTTGIEYSAPTMVKLVKPYHGSWMVLHREDNMTKLGCVEYVGTPVVTDDVYFNETNTRLRGNPVCLFGIDQISNYYFSKQKYGIAGTNLLGVFTDIRDEAGVYAHWDRFYKMDNFYRSIHPTYKSVFNYNDYSFAYGQGNDYGYGVVSDGVYYRSMHATKYYKAPIDPLLGEVYISHFAKTGAATLMYDSKGKRFLFNYWNESVTPLSLDFTDGNNSLIKAIPHREANIDLNVADPSKIDPNQEMLYVGSGYKYNPSMNWKTYGLGLSVKGKDSCFVYVFQAYELHNSSSNATFLEYNKMRTPTDLTNKSCFASSEFYNGLIFYASENKVYCFNYKQTTGDPSKCIYTHLGGSKAAKMRFARTTIRSNQDYTSYEFNPCRSLGVSFEMADGTSELVILNLSPSGSVGVNSASWEAKQVHKGFGKIKDFVFL